MRVLLAPMEGVLDPLVRDLLTAINHYDLCMERNMKKRIVLSGLLAAALTLSPPQAVRDRVQSCAADPVLNPEPQAAHEGTDTTVEVFVRDHGEGFDIDTIPPDRLGIRESIIGFPGIIKYNNIIAGNCG